MNGWPVWVGPLARRHRRLLGTIALAFGIPATLDGCFPLNLPDHNTSFSTVITDQSGRPLRAFADPNGIWRQKVSLDEVSPFYTEALLNYEDRWFWHHPGINPAALLRAFWLNWQSDRIISGGSTLTMQVARILHPHSRTYRGKMQQMLRAIQLEWHLSKTEILELYLNFAPFGGTIEGVQAASFAYLDKPASELTRAEAALMAVLPQSPSRLRPDRYPDRAQTARDKVLDRLVDQQAWSEEQVAAAKQEHVTGFPPQRPNAAPLLARLLKQRHNKLDDSHTISTTIDGNLQRGLEEYLNAFIHGQPKQSSGAILVVDNHTLSVKAYIGSADFGDSSRFGHVDMVQAVRSPGSTLKPFIYGLALDEGVIHSHSLMSDTPRHYGDYRPRNFHRDFSGPVSATEALQRSLNIPAVQTLELLGPRQFYSRLKSAQINLQLPSGSRPNTAIALGGVGTTLWDLVSGYSALVRQGKVAQPRLQPDTAITEHYLLSPEAAWVTYQMLATAPRPDQVRMASIKNSASSLAWKTGTSYGFRDAWAIGVNADYTIGVWLGRPDGTPMPGHFGALNAAPLLFKIANALPAKSTAPLPQPSEVAQQVICWPLGTLKTAQAKEHCHQQQSAWVVRGQVPPTPTEPEHSGWYSNPLTLWLDNRTGQLAAPNTASHDKIARQVALWPKALEPWVPRRWSRRRQIPASSVNGNVLLPVVSGELKITGLDEGYILRAARAGAEAPVIALKSIGGSGKRSWFCNGRFIGESGEQQTMPFALNNPGILQIVVIDSIGNLDRVTFKVLVASAEEAIRL